MGRYRDYRGVFRPVGAVIIGLGLTMIVCALAGWLFDLAAGQPLGRPSGLFGARTGGEWALGLSAACALGVGALSFSFGRRHFSALTTRREAVLAVGLIWFSAAAIGAVPFVLGADMGVVDGFFEAVSGLTTTGATVIADIESRMSRSLLLWRSVLQWLGGMGIVVLFVAVFPNIGAGGKHMFGEEVPGTAAEGLRPRIAETSRVLWQFYVVFTAVEVGVLGLLGMPWFDALCHALTTMSTGGFSTKDASIGAFDKPALEFAVAFFMLAASVNYGLYYGALKGRSLKPIFRSVEFRSFVGITVLSVVGVTLGIWRLHGDLFEAFRRGTFTVATFVSSTGYLTDDYMAYPPGPLWIVLTLMFVGGCAGSTAGGIKIERVILMAKVTWTELRRSFRPALVHVVRLGKKVVQASDLTDVSVFFVIYMGSLAVVSGSVAWLEGVPMPTAFGAGLTCLSNMGPAPFHADADHFAAYGGAAKAICALGMLLGRLEFFALLALTVPEFWRR
ncbi:MAG TPA: potassium transporter TrkG [Myxococcales bacterium LLY-WYZ-16_1]|nr:potassium transporter TrkG [Myxococcales bacterium LLY-WYZ-16_1]